MSHEHNILKLGRKSGLLLSLCLAGLLGCATTGQGSSPSDGEISMKVGNKLRRDPEIDRFRIDVDTINGVVYLRGEVRNQHAADEAEHLATKTNGVVRVVNELIVTDQPYGAGVAFDDRWIVTMVEAKLARDPTVRSRNVDVDAQRGVVTLSGIVEDEHAKQEAEYVARSVDGVNQVINQLQIQQGGDQDDQREAGEEAEQAAGPDDDQ